VKTLGDLHGLDPDTTSAALERFVHVNDGSRRLVGLETLTRFQKGRTVLKKLLNDPDVSIRIKATNALQEIPARVLKNDQQ
jgi:hypothetical protein